MPRRLIVNADDFGFTRDVNAGIVEACERGILRATTLMANGEAFEHAVDLAARTPQLDIGCHLTLVGGASVADRLVSAMALPRPVTPFGPAFSGASSTIEFHAPQDSHLPTQRWVMAPQLWQT